MNNGVVTIEDLQKDPELRVGLKRLVAAEQKRRWSREVSRRSRDDRYYVCKQCGANRPDYTPGCRLCDKALQGRDDSRRKTERARQKRAALREAVPPCPGYEGAQGWKKRKGSCPNRARYEVAGVKYCAIHEKIARKEETDGKGPGTVVKVNGDDAKQGSRVEDKRHRARPAKPRLRIRNIQA